MQLKSGRTVAFVAAATALTATAVAVAARHGSGGSSTVATADSATFVASGKTAGIGKDAFLDDVAKRLGIERSKLDAALQQIALDDVDWAVDAGFLSKEQGDLLKQRIKAGDGRFGHGFGHVGLGGHLFAANGFLAAAQYLGLSAVQLETQLDTKTLAQIAKDQGKSVDGLKKALTSSAKEALDAARTAGRITQKQADALLDRYSSTLDDLVNGRSPELTALAKELGIDRAKVEAAVKAARIAQVDQAVADARITKEQGDALKKRIESGAGFGHGFAPGFGRHGFDGHGPGGDDGHGFRAGPRFGFRGAPGFGFRAPSSAPSSALGPIS